MEFRKGKKNTQEWDHMIVHNDLLFMGVHYAPRGLTIAEKKIISNYLDIAAKEIDAFRKNHAK